MRTTCVVMGVLMVVASTGARAMDPAPGMARDALPGANRSSAAQLPPGHPPIAPSRGHGMAGGEALKPGVAGEVIEVIDTGNYTYVQVRGPDRTIWAATERFAVKVGDRVVIPAGMLMRNFESPTLGRTFAELYFVESIGPESPGAAAPSGAAESAAGAPVVVEPPEGGLSIAEVHARRAELAGQDVTVRGRVTKYTERVLDRNWLHLADGSGGGEAADLTVTTEATSRVGDVVTVRGRVAVDEDLGHGYRYDVLLKDAALLDR